MHFIIDALNGFDLSQAFVNHRGTGIAQYPPRMLLGLLIYGYATGRFSSRGKKCLSPTLRPQHLGESPDMPDNTLLIYLTDGYGSFSKFIPEQPVPWVVTAGGLPSEQFPFGEVARLRE